MELYGRGSFDEEFKRTDRMIDVVFLLIVGFWMLVGCGLSFVAWRVLDTLGMMP